MNRTFIPAGPAEAEFGADALPALVSCVQRATEVSMALLGRFQQSPSTRALAREAPRVAPLLPLGNWRLYVVRQWFETGRMKLVAYGPLEHRMRALLAQSVSAHVKVTGWEDLALYASGGRVLLWTCTHESFGVVYGTEAFLRDCGLRPRPLRPLRPVSAESLDSDAEAVLLSGTPPPR